ncbi:SRPBCC family protein [bacterium]|nr:SRPBCC family protein [bacterium]
MHELVREQVVAAPLDRVFAYFDRPENLARLTPTWLDFRILTPSPVPMERGALIDYEISLGPLPMRWRTLITRYEPPHLFVDEQLAGPYSFWHHTHTFREVPGGTAIGDHVRYELPFGPLGRLAHALVVRRQLDTIFRFRTEAVAREFGP